TNCEKTSITLNTTLKLAGGAISGLRPACGPAQNIEGLGLEAHVGWERLREGQRSQTAEANQLECVSVAKAVWHGTIDADDEAQPTGRHRERANTARGRESDGGEAVTSDRASPHVRVLPGFDVVYGSPRTWKTRLDFTFTEGAEGRPGNEIRETRR